MTTTAQPAAEPTAAPRVNPMRVLAPIARDVAVPIGAYFLLTALSVRFVKRARRA